MCQQDKSRQVKAFKLVKEWMKCEVTNMGCALDLSEGEWDKELKSGLRWRAEAIPWLVML